MCDYLHLLHSKSNAVHHVQLMDRHRDAQLCLFLLAEISVSSIMPSKMKKEKKDEIEKKEKLTNLRRAELKN